LLKLSLISVLGKKHCHLSNGVGLGMVASFAKPKPVNLQTFRDQKKWQLPMCQEAICKWLRKNGGAIHAARRCKEQFRKMRNAVLQFLARSSLFKQKGLHEMNVPLKRQQKKKAIITIIQKDPWGPVIVEPHQSDK